MHLLLCTSAMASTLKQPPVNARPLAHSCCHGSGNARASTLAMHQGARRTTPEAILKHAMRA